MVNNLSCLKLQFVSSIYEQRKSFDGTIPNCRRNVVLLAYDSDILDLKHFKPL